MTHIFLSSVTLFQTNSGFSAPSPINKTRMVDKVWYWTLFHICLNQL